MVTIRIWEQDLWKDSFQKILKKPLVDKLLFGNLKAGGQIKLDIKAGNLKFSEIKKKVKV
jgi:hypothetical protein